MKFEESDPNPRTDVEMTPCAHCAKPTPKNYLNPPILCSWECRVAACEAGGGERHTPNGLPVMFIRSDGLMTECAHGDHEDYLFPVKVIGGEDCESYPQTHALVYTDGRIALTLYETSPAIWSAREGRFLGGLYQSRSTRLSDESLAAIAEHMKKVRP